MRHLLWHKRTGRRKLKGIVRTRRAVARTTRNIARAERLRRQSEERIKRLDRILVADNSSVPKTTRAAPRFRKAKRRKKALERHLEVVDGHLEGMNDHRELLERHLERMATARTRAKSEATKARRALLDFPVYLRHGRGSDPGRPMMRISWVSRTRPPIQTRAAGTRRTKRSVGSCVQRGPHGGGCGSAASSAGREHTQRGIPEDRKPTFVDKMQGLASCLHCHRQRCAATRDIQKKRGQDIVGGVWNGVWRAITRPRGAWAFAFGAGSVIASLVLPGVAVQLAADTVAALELKPGFWAAVKLAFPLVVVGGAYWWFRGYEHGRAVVWGAAALTMLGLTTIEFTALEADLADVFDSQRVTVMQLVIVAMLFIGQEFGTRAAAYRQHEFTHDQEEFAELQRGAELDLSNCLGKVREGPCNDFKDSVTKAGARFANPRNRERRVVLLVTALYLAVCVHFVSPALSWDGLRPSGVLVHGDALNVAAVAGTVVLLPVFSLWSAWMETKGDVDG